MKNKLIVPTLVEKKMRAHDFIVSKTDTSGRIVYGNRTFIEFSGYEEQELLGSQHNIIRHPDMPRSAFALAWDTIKKGNEFFAYVKNMAKDGSYYWVFANITPDFDASGQITGFFSVRRAPKKESIGTIETVYRVMLDAERKAGPKDALKAGTQVLLDILKEKGLRYDQLILAI